MVGVVTELLVAFIHLSSESKYGGWGRKSWWGGKDL